MKNRIERVAFGLFLLVTILPICLGLIYALGYSVGLFGLLSDGFTLSHWHKVVSSREIWYSLAVSGYVAAATVLVTIPAAILTTAGLRHKVNRGAFGTALYLPLTLPATVAAFVVFQLFSGGGWLNRIPVALGLISDPAQMPPVIHDSLSLGVIIAHAFLAWPFFTLFFTQVYAQERLSAQCKLTLTLGGSRWDCLMQVIAPVMLWRGRTQIVLLFIAVMGSYEIPLLLGKQSPQMISVLTMRKYELFNLASKPEAYIAALLYTALVTLCLALTFRGRKDGTYA